MTVSDPTTLKTYFQSGDRPTQSQFEDLIDTSIRPTMVAISTAVEYGGKVGLLEVSAQGVGFNQFGSAGGVLLQQTNMAAVRNLTWPQTTPGGIHGYFNGQNTILTPGSSDTVLHGGTLPSYGKVTENDIAVSGRSVGALLVHGSANTDLTLITGATANKVLAAQGPTAVPAYIDMYQYLGSFSVSSSVIECNNIPSWANRVRVCINGVSSSTVVDIELQLGNASSYITSGYVSGALESSQVGSTTGLVFVRGISTTALYYGLIELQRGADNVWFCNGSVATTTSTRTNVNSGFVNVGAALTKLKVMTASGAVDAGTIQVWAYR